jgi:AraC family transcriptional regulator
MEPEARIDMRRISVVTNNKLVPLFSGTPIRDSRFSPWKGLLVEAHEVGPIEIPEHEHSSLCLNMQTTSSPVELEWWCDGKCVRSTATAGSVILTPLGTRDSLKLNRPSRRLLVSIEEPLLRRASVELEIQGPLTFEKRWIFKDNQLRLLLSEIEREMLANWSMGQLYGDMLGMALSLALIKNHSHSDIALPFAKGGLTPARLKRVLGYMNDYCHKNLRLTELAEVAQTSLYHFSHLFQESMGMPPHRYLMQMRIEKAKALMRVPRYSMAQIATATGFANSSHFGKAFRRFVGATPSEYKVSSKS